MSVIDVQRDDDVALVVMQNEEGFNSFDPTIIRQLRTTFDALLADDDVRGIVLTGAGSVFSAGANVPEMAQAAQKGQASRWVLDATAELHPLLETIVNTPKPVIAAVNGVAAGGGLGLAVAADARIGSMSARFAAGYFGLGLSPDGGSTWLLPRLIGWQRTKRFFFDNEVMDAPTAKELGLLDAIEDDAELVQHAIDVARRWGAWAACSRESTKRLMACTLDQDLRSQLELERGLIAAAAGTADFREGTQAFVDKRPPSFK